MDDFKYHFVQILFPMIESKLAFFEVQEEGGFVRFL